MPGSGGSVSGVVAEIGREAVEDLIEVGLHPCEAGRLQEDLRRAGIEPMAWIVNQSFAATATRDPILGHKAEAERIWLEEVDRLSRQMAVVAWQTEPVSP